MLSGPPTRVHDPRRLRLTRYRCDVGERGRGRYQRMRLPPVGDLADYGSPQGGAPDAAVKASTSEWHWPWHPGGPAQRFSLPVGHPFVPPSAYSSLSSLAGIEMGPPGVHSCLIRPANPFGAGLPRGRVRAMRACRSPSHALCPALQPNLPIRSSPGRASMACQRIQSARPRLRTVGPTVPVRGALGCTQPALPPRSSRKFPSSTYSYPRHTPGHARWTRDWPRRSQYSMSHLSAASAD